MGGAKTAASGRYLLPSVLTHRNRPVRRRSIWADVSAESSICLSGKDRSGRQNHRVMGQRACRRVVSATLHTIPADRSRTLVQRNTHTVADAARRLKILVPVVRFRPGPPKNSAASKRQPSQVGVFVFRTSPQVLGILLSLLCPSLCCGYLRRLVRARFAPPCHSHRIDLFTYSIDT